MKFLLLLTFIAIATANEYLATDESDTMFIAKFFSSIFNISMAEGLECINKSEVTEDNLLYLEYSLRLEDSEITDKISLRIASCALVCCAQKQGIMIGAEVQLQKIFDELLGDLPKDVDSIVRNSANVCKEQVQNQTDECLAGYDFIKCTFKRSRPLLEEE